MKKDILKKIKKFLTNEEYRNSWLTAYGFYNWMPDEAFLKMRYQKTFGKTLDLENPTSFNEKLQWLKLYNKKPVYTNMVDKCEAKRYVAECVGAENIIPTLGVWEQFDDIDFDALPDQFVIKCTHDSGGLVIVRDKSALNYAKVKRKITRCLRRNYFKWSREWPYKNVPPRILVEQYMQDGQSETLNVFKIFNFNGEPRIIQMIQGDKTADETIDYFDTDWNLLELRQNFPNSSAPVKRPETLDEMLDLARKLSADTAPFIRTDFYEINGKVYFSEFTFYSDAGLAKFQPEKWDAVLGSWIDLSTVQEQGKSC